MKARIKLLTHGARAPEYAKPGDSGCDLRWFEETVSRYALQPLETRVFWTGVAIELPTGMEAQVRPRSGLSSKGVMVHFGTVDSGYRGDIGVTITNLSREMQTFVRGDRVAQLVIAPVTRVEWELADELSDTARGEGGFGSSGVR